MYLSSIDEVPTSKLLDEIKRRNIALINLLCPYCEQSIVKHSCKYKDKLDQYQKHPIPIGEEA